jgi:hypothetical protein
LGLATFIGQETGGGYYGNTSGYSQDLTSPNSKITIEIPALQFVMNVEPKLPFGSGVKPHYEVIPTINQYMNNENPCLEYALKLINEKQMIKKLKTVVVITNGSTKNVNSVPNNDALPVSANKYGVVKIKTETKVARKKL